MADLASQVGRAAAYSAHPDAFAALNFRAVSAPRTVSIGSAFGCDRQTINQEEELFHG